MSEADAEQKAEKPERLRKAGGGTAESKQPAHQADTACNEHTGDRIPVTSENVLCRENMLRTYQRVVSNQGAPGVDGITVDELMPMLRTCWDAIREELLDGTYQPAPVRKVEIPKPGGKGVRTLRIPTVLDRLIQQALYQARELMRRGLARVREWVSATNGHGPWWNAGASHMNQAVPNRYLPPAWSCQPPSRIPAFGAFPLNPRIQNRTYGGVGGRGRQRPLLPAAMASDAFGQRKPGGMNSLYGAASKVKVRVGDADSLASCRSVPGPGTRRR
jgi:hypothetical protein